MGGYNYHVLDLRTDYKVRNLENFTKQQILNLQICTKLHQKAIQVKCNLLQ